MRRPLVAHLAVAAVALSLAACSAADGGGETRTTDTVTPEKVAT